jgi:protocatechuate 3,4-dioxygenase beta subunit
MPIMKRPDNRSTLARRQLLAGVAGLPLAAFGRAGLAQAGSRTPTPTQTLGPFYPRNASERPRETDADLLAVEGQRVLAQGVPIFLVGRVLNRRGEPVSGAEVEIWQCDAQAVYHHPAGGAEGERDPGFQGYGIDRTAESGEFRFRTIRPVPYPGRTAHIHVRIRPQSGSTLATQLYLADSPDNARDFLFSRLSPQEQRQLLLAFEPTTQTTHPLARDTRFTARVELVLA